MKQRVVVTGLGGLSSLGHSVESIWKNILEGTSGIKTIKAFDVSAYTTRFAGMIQDFRPETFLDAKEIKKHDSFIVYGLYAADQAIEDAGLANFANLNRDRVGCCIGSGIGGLGTIERYDKILVGSGGPKRISPFFIPASIVNMISGNVSIKHGYRGPNLAVATACTTGTHSIGLGARTIAYGDADVMIVGGAEAATTPLGLAGFAAARALSQRNDSPTTASRPWDQHRDGFVLGDGAGVLVLESLTHAQNRGAKIYAELAGFGMSADAFHITRPAQGGVGASLCMREALKDANITYEAIDYINAHGTSTPAGDLEEILAIQSVFQAHAKALSVSSTKSMIGHLLGAAGAVEAIFTVLSLRDQICPPTVNLDTPDSGCDLDLVPKVAKERKIQYALSNSFGFGGTNGCLIFKKFS